MISQSRFVILRQQRTSRCSWRSPIGRPRFQGRHARRRVRVVRPVDRRRGQHSYFGRDEWAPFVKLKSIADALEIRQRILSDSSSPSANRTPLSATPGSPSSWSAESDRWNCRVRCAGGAARSGVRLRRINPAQAHVILLEGPIALLLCAGALREGTTAAATSRGRRPHRSKVTSIDAEGINIGPNASRRDGSGAAGVGGSGFGGALGMPLDETGVVVGTDLSIAGRPSRRGRSGVPGRERGPGARCPRRDPGCSEECTAHPARRAFLPSLPEQGLARDDRAKRSGPARHGQAIRTDCGLRGRSSRPLPRRLPKPIHDRLPMGVVVRLLRPRRALHNRPAPAKARSTERRAANSVEKTRRGNLCHVATG